MILALVADLFFAARIRETAKQLGAACEIVRDPHALPDVVPDLVIVDMNLRTGDAAAFVRDYKAAHPEVTVVGYLFDAHEDLIQAARAAGCDRVLSRGGLTKKLPDLVRGTLS